MKPSISQTLAVAFVVSCLNLNTLAEPRPGEVDFGKFSGLGKDAKLVEISLKRSLICLAAKIVEDQEPEVAKLLRSVQMIRVNVIGLTDKNREEMEQRVSVVRGQLDKEGWERIVTAQEQNGEDVGVYVKTRGDEALEGLVVTVVDGSKKEVVFINLVGDIRPEQIATVGRALDIDPLKKAGRAIQK
jgi:hypothetical protein